jgi:hypothetical protein
MSMDLGVGIKIDPGSRSRRRTRPRTRCTRTEDRGIAAGKAMLGLAGNFKSLGAGDLQQHVTRSSAAMRRTIG